MPPEQTQPTPKQQVTEVLRQAQTLVVTTSKNPGVDEVAAVVALTQMLEKTGKRAEPVVSTSLPGSLNFLPLDKIHNQFAGLRDFVIELDTSKTEADKLKYIPEGKRLKIFITPFNGSFKKEDLGFSYGDYHCDAVVVLGAKGLEDTDTAIANQKQLLDKAKVIFINTGAGGHSQGKFINWAEPQAISLCEILMSLTEALQPGLLDNHLAGSLLTGIVAKTNHFTASNTTPKVMTMAAQLLAAGADQASIVKHLTEGEHVKPQNQPAPQGALAPSREQALPHQEAPKVEPAAPLMPKDAVQAPNKLEEPKPPQPPIVSPAKAFEPTPEFEEPPKAPYIPPFTHAQPTAAPTPPAPVINTPPSIPTPPPVVPPPAAPQAPQPPKAAGLWGELPPQAPAAPPPLTPSAPLNEPPSGTPKLDVEAARRAVQEAANEVVPPTVPPPPPVPPAPPAQ